MKFRYALPAIASQGPLDKYLKKGGLRFTLRHGLYASAQSVVRYRTDRPRDAGRLSDFCDDRLHLIHLAFKIRTVAGAGLPP